MFIFLILYIIACIFAYGFIKYLGKVAQANILPTSNEVVPFDEATYTLEENKILVPVGEDEEGTKWSREILFPLEANLKHQHSVFGFLYDQMHKKKTASCSLLYFYMIAQSLFTTNFYLINKIFLFLNTYCYNFVLLIFGIHLLPIILHILVFVDSIYFVFLWFYNLSYFWYEKEDDPNDEEKVRYIPKPVQILIFSGSFFTFIEMWFLVTLLMILGILIVPLAGYFFALFAFFFPLSVTCVTKDNEPFGVWKMVKDMLMYQNSLIASFASFIILTHLSQYGYKFALFFLIAILCLCLMTKAYENNKIKDTTNLEIGEVSMTQSVRIVEVIAIPEHVSEDSNNDTKDDDAKSESGGKPGGKPDGEPDGEPGGEPGGGEKAAADTSETAESDAEATGDDDDEEDDDAKSKDDATPAEKDDAKATDDSKLTDTKPTDTKPTDTKAVDTDTTDDDKLADKEKTPAIKAADTKDETPKDDEKGGSAQPQDDKKVEPKK